MGAQAAALLEAGGPVGDVPRPQAHDGALQLTAPDGYDLRAVALLHSGVGLAPTAWDGDRLHLRLPGPVAVDARLRVWWAGRQPDAVVLRRVLDLDTPYDELWEACDRVPELAGLRPRVLRAPTVWQDLVGVLAGTRASYASTQAMVRSLVRGGPFPDAAQVRDADLGRWGYRAPWLREVADRVVQGWDPEQLLDPAPTGAQVLDRVRELPGFGPFAAAQLQPLLGRPRPLVLDGWLRERLGGADDEAVARRFAAMGRWAGTGAWLAAVGARAH